MKNTSLLLFLLVSSLLSAQKKTEEITSKTLNATRTISVVTPASYEAKKDKKYPLLLLLDGEYLVDPFAGTLAYTDYWNDLPEVIIVGIDQNKQNERAIDCRISEETGLPDEFGEKFFDFISLELLPYLEKKYRIAPFKIIGGHDLTAGYINYFLYKEKPLFNAYIAFSPELPTDMDVHVPERLAELQVPIFYYLATAEGDVMRLQKGIKKLNEGIKAVANPSLKYYFDDFKNATHYSLVTFGIPEALYHIFSSYQPISTVEYQEKIVTLKSGYVDYLVKKYDIIQKDLGVKIPIRINDFRAIEAAILKNGAYEELKALGELAGKNYPKTTFAEYYNGLYYEKTEDYKKAINAYMKGYTQSEVGDYTKDFMLNKADNLK
jgi:predicted alpha/beta superfamily hydrolase